MDIKEVPSVLAEALEALIVQCGEEHRTQCITTVTAAYVYGLAQVVRTSVAELNEGRKRTEGEQE